MSKRHTGKEKERGIGGERERGKKKERMIERDRKTDRMSEIDMGKEEGKRKGEEMTE